MVMVMFSVMKFVGYEYRKEHKKEDADSSDGADKSPNNSDID